MSLVRIIAAFMVANGMVIAAWFVLKAAWFGSGSIGCDDSDPLQLAGCDVHGDVLAWLALGELAFLVVSVLLIAGIALRRAMCKGTG